jgi:DNA repair protein RadA/Sms
MAKPQVQFVCQRCGRISAAYMGKCPQCGEFGTMVEQVVSTPSEKANRSSRSLGAVGSRPQKIGQVSTDDVPRLAIPIDEFTRVLGGGVVPGSLILVGGDPGIGKSTLLLEVATMMANIHGPCLYVSGEESVRQIKMRSDRMELKSDYLYLVTETNLETILAHVEEIKPVLTIVDSIQTTYTSDLSSSAGSVSQVRECASRFQELAKIQGLAVCLVGHVTKDGAIAGPRVLEHIVDTVLYLEGDPFNRYRLLRGVKNRFGATSEVGVFEMAERGMVEVTNPSEAFLAERQVNSSGSAIAVTLEGTRPLLVEIQALVNSTSFSNPRRTANGIDYNRLLMLSAVLSRRAKLNLSDKDVYVNVVGGLQIGEPAADLAVAIAIASSVRDKPVHADMAFMGEIGLSGELRSVLQLDLRLKEASKLGFRRCLIPRTAKKVIGKIPAKLEVITCASLADALAQAFISQG